MLLALLFLKLGVLMFNNLISVLKLSILLVTLKSKVALLLQAFNGVVEFSTSTGKLLVPTVSNFLLRSNYIFVVSSIGMVLKWTTVVKLILSVVLSISNYVVLMMITRFPVLLTIQLSITVLVIALTLNSLHSSLFPTLTSTMVVPF